MTSSYKKKDKEVFNIRGKEIEVESDFRFDSITNEKISDNKLDEIAINKAFEKFYKEYDYLRPSEIKEIRDKYGLSTRAFSKLTGIGTASINRYENGQIPSEANNRLLKLLKDDVSYVEKLYDENKEKLTVSEQELVYQVVKNKKEDSIDKVIKKELEDKEPSIFSGYRNFDFEKFKNLVLYFSSKINRLSKTKLNKLLFYSDFKSFQEETVSITGLSYIHDYYGPVVEGMNLLLSILEKNKSIEIKLFDDYEGEYIEALEDYDLSIFNKGETETIDMVIDRFKNVNAKEISRISHRELPYKETEMKELISYEYADNLKAI